MADIAVTASSVVMGTGAVVDRSRVAGEAGITAGMIVYLNGSNKYVKADNVTAAKATVRGIALNGAGTDQPIDVQTAGEITMGEIFTAGEVIVNGAGAGAIAPSADAGAGEYNTIIGVAKSTSVLIMGIQASGVAHG
jgi:hypothetical protein